MKALTLKQPWGWAMFGATILKPVENRSWGLSRMRVSYRGRLLIHVGVKPPRSGPKREYFERSRDFLIRHGQSCPEFDEITHRAILGVVDLWDIMESHVALQRVDFHAGFYVDDGSDCWMIRDHRPFATPIERAGGRGLFDIPDEEVRAALAAVGL